MEDLPTTLPWPWARRLAPPAPAVWQADHPVRPSLCITPEGPTLWEGERALATDAGLSEALARALTQGAQPLPTAAAALIAALTVPDRRGLFDTLAAAAPTDLLVDALDAADEPGLRGALAHLLGQRRDRAALPSLLRAMEAPDLGVRAAAAEAIGTLGDPSAGPALLRRLALPDPALAVRRAVLVALGAVRHDAALPLLITFLQNPDPAQRGGAAWSLGRLGDPRALAPLRAALATERSAYPKERMAAALAELERPAG